MKKNKILLTILCILGIVELTLVGCTKTNPKEDNHHKEKITVHKEHSAPAKQEMATEINSYLKDKGIDFSRISLAIFDLNEDIDYAWNADKDVVAASTYKVPLAMLWYDKINQGEISHDATLEVTPEDSQEGASSLADGQYDYPLSDLLELAITQSDNTAAHCLYRNLGSYQDFKEQATKYSKRSFDEDFYQDNNFTAHYMEDCIHYLYDHKDDYQELIGFMKEATPGQYLDTQVQISMPQKYGAVDNVVNAVGYVEAKQPYAIVVFTEGVDDAENVIGYINAICYKYFNN